MSNKEMCVIIFLIIWIPISTVDIFFRYVRIYKPTNLELIIPTRNVDGVAGGVENAA